MTLTADEGSQTGSNNIRVDCDWDAEFLASCMPSRPKSGSGSPGLLDPKL